MPQGQLPPVRWERFVHRDDDGPLIVGRAAHEAAGMADVYAEVERAQRGELADGYLLRGVTEQNGREIWEADIGELITDRGFLSVTGALHPEIVQALASLDEAVLLRIQLHVGAKVIYPRDAVPEDYPFFHELEIVIPLGTTLEIIGKHTHEGLRVVDLVIAYQPELEE